MRYLSNGAIFLSFSPSFQNLALLNQRIDKFKEGDLTRNDRLYKELDEQALKLMINCDELTDIGFEVKVKRKQMIHNIQRVLRKLESKVPIYGQQYKIDKYYSIAV